MTVIRIRKNLSNSPFKQAIRFSYRILGDLATAGQCVHGNNPLQTVSKRVYSVYTYSNCMLNQLLYCWQMI